MSVLVNHQTNVVICGATGRYASMQMQMMRQYGTKIVAGIAVGHGGEHFMEIPLYDEVAETLKNHRVDAAIVYAPAPVALEQFYELYAHSIKIIVIGTEGIPIHDGLKIRCLAEKRNAWVIGPNSLGIITPAETMLGSMAADFVKPGPVGLISRSGTLSNIVLRVLFESDIGISTAISIGGDRVIGRSEADYLMLFDQDPYTTALVMLCEIGGTMEYQAADVIAKISKPVVCYVVGRQAPPGKIMGHAGAFIKEKTDSAEEKINALTLAGARVARTPWEIPELLREVAS